MHTMHPGTVQSWKGDPDNALWGSLWRLGAGEHLIWPRFSAGIHLSAFPFPARTILSLLPLTFGACLLAFAYNPLLLFFSHSASSAIRYLFD